MIVLAAALAGTKTSIKNKLNRHHFRVFNTDETDPEKFWNNIESFSDRVDVGGLALHQGFMTANTRFNCYDVKYSNLSRKQQKIIEATLKCKDEPYSIVSTRGAMGKLFRIN